MRGLLKKIDQKKNVVGKLSATAAFELEMNANREQVCRL